MNDLSIPAKFPALLFERSFAAAFPDSMAIHCVVSLSGRIDEGRLARAVRLALDAEPILGCRFTEHWFRPSWRRCPTLDDLGRFETKASSDFQADLRPFLEAPPHLPLRVLLLRGETDLVCVSLDHRVGDGKALQDCAYLLVDIYNRLGDDPHYVPVPNVKGSRSLQQIAGRFSAREKWRIARHILKVLRERKRLGHWKYPIQRQGGSLEFDYVSWRLDAQQVRAIFMYGARHRATVSQVLLAAFYLAAYEVLPRSTDDVLPMNVAVDLRRNLPSSKASAFSNLTGNSVIAVDPRSATSMDAVLQQIRDQMKSQQKYLGLAISFFAFETLPVIRHLLPLVPQAWTKRSYRKRREEALAKEFIPPVVLLTHTGELDEHRLAFGGVPVADAYSVAGVAKVPGILGLSVSGFRGSLTLYLGVGPRGLMTRMAEHIKELLQVGAAAVAKT